MKRINHFAGKPRTADTNAIVTWLDNRIATVAEIAAATGIEQPRVKKLISGLVLRMQVASIGPRANNIKYRLTCIGRPATKS